jgi:hypothetical protein
MVNNRLIDPDLLLGRLNHSLGVRIKALTGFYSKIKGLSLRWQAFLRLKLPDSLFSNNYTLL